VKVSSSHQAQVRDKGGMDMGFRKLFSSRQRGRDQEFASGNTLKIGADMMAKISGHVSKEPFEFYQIGELANAEKWFSIEWANLQKALGTPIYYPPRFLHRKTWEYVQCVYGLTKLDVLREESIGLGIGVGHEELMYYFSNMVRKVVGTDLYEENSNWANISAKEGNPNILTDMDRFAPFPYRKERLEIMRMDGRSLDFPDASFDFIWSCSSIEHFGGHADAAKSMREMARVLKPGGILALATEFVLDQNIIPGMRAKDDEFFNVQDLYEFIISSHQLKLVQPIDFYLNEYYLLNHVQLPEESRSPHTVVHRKPHMVLCRDKVLFTSIFLFFRKET
jgi:SAM-dependent methyltransferase